LSQVLNLNTDFILTARLKDTSFLQAIF
jgi:hypothetical protein